MNSLSIAHLDYLQPIGVTQTAFPSDVRKTTALVSMRRVHRFLYFHCSFHCNFGPTSQAVVSHRLCLLRCRVKRNHVLLRPDIPCVAGSKIA
jgi:hypothetical protein